MPEQPAIPSVLAFLVCDHVITEAQTSKRSLIGLFDRVWVSQFPTSHGPIWVYAKLADAEGQYVFRVEIVKLDSDKPIGRVVTAPIKITDRLAAGEMALQIPVIPFPEAGKYEMQLFANDVWIGRTILTVEKRGEKK